MSGQALLPTPAPALALRVHGGPDALGAAQFDFSTNSNACGPCPQALAMVQHADASRYPDASYAALRQQLAAFHGVDAGRVVLAGSASEFIFRMTAWVARQGASPGHALAAPDDAPAQPRVHLPLHSYGDYAHAAQAWGLSATPQPDDAQLLWACEPSSPLGQAHAGWPRWLTQDPLAQRQNPVPAPLVLDCAYAPLRLSGTPSLSADQRHRVWQLYSPNKALGLTGVRAAYALAPLGSEASVAALNGLCASWPLGVHGVALLQAWVQADVQAWLAHSLHTLAQWKTRQHHMLQTRGWTCLPSDANFFCAQPAPACDLSRLRAAGIQLRDATSFGLPGHVRLGVLPPQAQEALQAALTFSSGI